MRRIIVWTFIVLVALFLPVTANAQTPPKILNPNTITFPCSPDHATLTKYQMGVFPNNTSIYPVKLFDLGKPTPNGSNVCEGTFDPLLLDVGVWYVRVVAVATAGSSTWTDVADDTAERLVAPPAGKPVLSKK